MPQAENSRLDRIEAIMLDLASASVRRDNEFSRVNALLESNAALLQDLATHQREAQVEMRASINDLIDMIGTLSQNADLHWNAIQEMQSEVRGLQTENRRILDRLERHTSDGHGGQY